MPRETGSTPDYVVELEELRQNGGLKRANELVRTRAEVWVKRSSGKWQKCQAVEIVGSGVSVVVKWEDENTGKELMRIVPTKQFLELQDEYHDSK